MKPECQVWHNSSQARKYLPFNGIPKSNRFPKRGYRSYGFEWTAPGTPPPSILTSFHLFPNPEKREKPQGTPQYELVLWHRGWQLPRGGLRPLEISLGCEDGECPHGANPMGNSKKVCSKHLSFNKAWQDSIGDASKHSRRTIWALLLFVCTSVWCTDVCRSASLHPTPAV